MNKAKTAIITAAIAASSVVPVVALDAPASACCFWRAPTHHTHLSDGSAVSYNRAGLRVLHRVPETKWQCCYWRR